MHRFLAAMALAGLLFLATPGAAKETFDSGDIVPGGTFAFTFRDPFPDGHTYHCHPHPDMQGMVHVAADTDGTTRVHHVDIVEGAQPSEWGYSVEHLMIEAGDTVVWTNKGSMVHTVTEGGDHSGHGDHTTADGHDAHDHGEDSSAAPLAAIGVALLGALFLRRR